MSFAPVMTIPTLVMPKNVERKHLKIINHHDALPVFWSADDPNVATEGQRQGSRIGPGGHDVIDDKGNIWMIAPTRNDRVWVLAVNEKTGRRGRP